ncbi:MAG: lipid-A-disaccharide synthase [Rhodospirillales bacterium]|nr:lipid-A-disaccharide synthase [Alphaproteobacteria bacterium]USO03308.1 MAG: lipid-A-disaccharide synthase [Rhodospirillales bacterium]
MREAHIYLIAGEASGDFLGAQLMKSLKEARPGIRFSGIGGPLMEAEGLQSIFPYEELSLMGILEVLPNIIHILKRIKQTIENIEKINPDILVTIDAPDFSFRVVKGVRKRVGAPPEIIHYVAPTVWAWRAGRAKKIAKILDGLICLLDFEPPYFEKEGLKAVAVGHPLVEGEAFRAQGGPFRAAHNIPQDAATIGVFFGSRKEEFKRLGCVLHDVMKNFPQAQFIVPTLPHLERDIRALTDDMGAPVHITTDKREKWEAFAACDAAVAASGTVGLELAAAGVPHVIAYRMSALTWAIVKRVVKVRYAHLGNIMLDREVIPEFLQPLCRADLISLSLKRLLTDEKERQKQIDAFEKIRVKLGAHDPKTPSEKAAEFVLSFLD